MATATLSHVNVELRLHKGKKDTELGVVELEHDQFMVFASSNQQPHPVLIGYIGKKPGSPFNGIHAFRVLPQPLKDAIVAAIRNKRGQQTRVFEPPTPPEPESPDPVKDEEDDEDVELEE